MFGLLGAAAGGVGAASGGGGGAYGATTTDETNVSPTVNIGGVNFGVKDNGNTWLIAGGIGVAVLLGVALLVRK